MSVFRSILAGVVIVSLGLQASTAGAAKAKKTFPLLLATDGKGGALQDELIGSGVLETAAAYSSVAGLTRPVMAIFRDCGGKANAWYSPDKHEITLCWEDIALTSILLSRREAWAAERWTIAHEGGHARVDILDLSLPGGEESNADQFATVLLLSMGDLEGVLAAADYFDIMDDIFGHNPADTHPAGKERAANLRCLALGWASAAGDSSLDFLRDQLGGRAPWCDREWAIASAAWPHV